VKQQVTQLMIQRQNYRRSLAPRDALHLGAILHRFALLPASFRRA
jgi:hypothetical protein